jgi:hypothetical protein
MLDKTERLYDGVQVKVPSDYPTLQDAINDLSSRYSPKQGELIEILIESGHELTHGLLVSNGDFRHFIISSEDAEVPLAEGFVGVTAESTQPNSCIVGSNASMPTLNCLINANDRCNAGYYAAENSLGYVNADCGVIYAGTLGLYASGSIVFAPRSNFSYGNNGNRITAASKAHLEGANLSNARGLLISPADTYCLDVSRGSVVYAMTQSGRTADCSNSAGRGLSVRRSWVAASGVDCSNAALDGIRAELGSHIVVTSGVSTGCGGDGVACYTGSTIAAQDVVANNCTGRGFFANSGANIDADNTIADNCLVGYKADKGSSINASDGSCDGSSSGVQAFNGSTVNFQSGSAIGCTNNGVEAIFKGDINLGQATITGSGGNDIRISRGSMISANNCTTTNGAGNPNALDCNVASFNTPSGSDGIIWG